MLICDTNPRVMIFVSETKSFNWVAKNILASLVIFQLPCEVSKSLVRFRHPVRHLAFLHRLSFID